MEDIVCSTVEYRRIFSGIKRPPDRFRLDEVRSIDRDLIIEVGWEKKTQYGSDESRTRVPTEFLQCNKIRRSVVILLLFSRRLVFQVRLFLSR